MLIHRQNSHAPRDKQRTGRLEGVNKVKNKSLLVAGRRTFGLSPALAVKYQISKALPSCRKQLKF
jgi:hypothetical protein